MTSRGLVLVLLAGAALRFATLDTQSLWYDEAVTAHLLAMDLPGMLRAIPDSESSPPLYYVLAWLWTHVFGTGEVGLRSLSALLGTATIAVAWALGRRLYGERGGLAAAALAACNPMLVWFSQEARAYALYALLGALATLLWLRALTVTSSEGRRFRRPEDETVGLRRFRRPQDEALEGRRFRRPQDTTLRPLLAWGAAAALGLATHYYAVFLLAPQALWLVLRAPGARERAVALALPVAAALALAPLALGQRANDTAAFIGESGLATRLAQLPKQFLVGYDAPLEPLLIAASGLAVLAGLAGLAALLGGRLDAPAGGRRDGARLAAITLATLALALLGAIAGEDHLLTRNVLPALPLLCALAGAGLAAAGGAAQRGAALALGATCLAGIVAIVGVARSPALQRDDWRAAVGALGPITAPRLIVATPQSALRPLRYYLPRLRRAAPPSFTTAEIDHIALPERLLGERRAPPRPAQPAPPQANYTLAQRTHGETFTVLRWQAPAPQAAPIAPSPGLDGTPAALLSVDAP